MKQGFGIREDVTWGKYLEFPSFFQTSVCKRSAEITGPPPDIDGCLEDEVAYKASCYRFDVKFTSYDKSEKTCKDWGGQLLSLQSE